MPLKFYFTVYVEIIVNVPGVLDTIYFLSLVFSYYASLWSEGLLIRRSTGSRTGRRRREWSLTPEAPEVADQPERPR